MSFKENLNKEFIISLETVPPKGRNLEKILEKLKQINLKINVINVVDSPLGIPRMHPLALCHKIQELGFETIMHFTCRDRNKNEIEADLLAAYSLGIKNILALTGDSTKNAKPVFEFSSLDLIEFINELNKKHGTNFFVGAGMNINSPNLEAEIKKTLLKIKKGAKFIMTQPCFEIKKIKKIKKKIKIPIIVGVLTLFNMKSIETFKNIPGIKIPENLIKIINDKEKTLKYYHNLIKEIKNSGVAGISIMGLKEYGVLNKII